MNLLLAFLVAMAPVDEPASIGPALVAAHNRERAVKGLPPLVAEPRLTEAARVHALDMAAHANMSHEGSDDSKPADRVKKVGYLYVNTGENVAKGQPSVASVMTGWMNSPHHRDNILTADYTEIGVARAFDEDDVPYWCVEFGQPFPRLDPSKAEADLAHLIHKARTDADKPPLRLDPKLAAAARLIAGDLANKDRKGKNPSFGNRMKASGYRYIMVAQSGSTGAPTPESVLKAINESPDQKRSILGDFADLGVGYALADDGRPSWCLLFAKPFKP